MCKHIKWMEDFQCDMILLKFLYRDQYEALGSLFSISDFACSRICYLK